MDDIGIKPYDLTTINGLEFKKFLKYCHDNGASDITIQGGDYIWVEKHGRQFKGTTSQIAHNNIEILIPQLWSADVLSNIRGGKGADRALELSYIDNVGITRGDYIRFRTNFIQARVAKLGETISITMRIIPSTLPNLNDLKIETDLFESFFPQMGLILVCGPTGSGKTTLQTAVYCHIGEKYKNRKTITYEDPIEFVLGGNHWDGVQPSQSQIGKDIASFAQGLKMAMRRKPSVIGIGEARDLETIDAMIEAALSGHLTYATNHTESVAETINRLIQVYPPAQQSAIASRLLGTLSLVVVQRLLKTVDGKRAPIREYLVFTKEIKRELQSESFEKWGFMINDFLMKTNSTLIDKAWNLLESNIIDEDEFIEIGGRKELSKRKGKENDNIFTEMV